MTVTELIEGLEKVKKEHGDIEVVVQYRDGGGCYNGTDSDIDPRVEDDILIL